MPSYKVQKQRSSLEQASWIAAIVSVLLTLGFGAYQMFQSNANSGATATIAGNSGPVLLAQGSPGATFIVNVPPATQVSDQDNCQEGERWVGAKPHTVSWTGEVPSAELSRAKFFGRFRWSPVIATKNATTSGKIEIIVGGNTTKIYEWNSPATETFAIERPVANLFLGASGQFTIRWRYTGGTSGICVEESRIGT